MAGLFSKRLSCFYCGRSSAKSNKESVQKWQCKHCEAVNYLDENGEITDPPAAETNPNPPTPGPSSPGFGSADFGLTGTGLFCDQCTRNQHLFTRNLASYLPSSDDPNYSAYERDYPKFRKNLEERYPQVCDKCAPRVKERIRQTGYEAKSDHLRRIMDRSKAGKAARKARQWNWRSLLVFMGAICYWTSIAGQLAWNLTSALTIHGALEEAGDIASSSFVASYFQKLPLTYRLPRHSLVDLASYAGFALVAGILSLWWNPKLRLKVEGRGGRFIDLGEYYKVQLIVMVVRCAFWAVLRDPSSSGLDPTLPPALHSFMVLFTILSVIISRRVVRYDTRPLVNWSDLTPAATPARKSASSPQPTTNGKQPFYTPHERVQKFKTRFPLEKLATPRSAQGERTIPTPPPEVDDMDWTPSIQNDLRPVSTIHQRDQISSALEGPTPFYGSLPPAPKPPSWNLRNQPSQRQKPIDQVVERNPFHRSPIQPSSTWRRNTGSSDATFAPPKFFPVSDHASTGLENLFDRTFTIKSPEDDEDGWRSPYHPNSRPQSVPSTNLRGALVSQIVRLCLLLGSLLSWSLSQYKLVSIPGDYVEVASLGSASLTAGFALLESLKKPILQWNGMEILVYFAELAAAVHLGGYLPGSSRERHYFDRYGKLLLVFMIVQEILAVLTLYRAASTTDASVSQEQQLHHPFSPNVNSPDGSPRSMTSKRTEYHSFSSPISSTAPPALSFSSTAAGSSFMTHQPEQPQYQLPFPSYDNVTSFYNNNKDHSFSLTSLKRQEANASDFDNDRESDTETNMTTATNVTSNTIRNIRYGRDSTVNDTFFSPKRSELGPGIGGLSLEDSADRSSKRMTRSQSQRLMGQTQLANGLRKRGLR
ncbi:Ima1 N-terminal domain-containing protein [Aspergillus pseudoustus]|uniref:Ima1 N-terminal domain-containing protein n=1 Tax=Aspergillus pseudoustus TaxID=1810923 RepID=A0ABR4KZS0_9EURO